MFCGFVLLINTFEKFWENFKIWIKSMRFFMITFLWFLLIFYTLFNNLIFQQLNFSPFPLPTPLILFPFFCKSVAYIPYIVRGGYFPCGSAKNRSHIQSCMCEERKFSCTFRVHIRSRQYEKRANNVYELKWKLIFLSICTCKFPCTSISV